MKVLFVHDVSFVACELQKGLSRVGVDCGFVDYFNCLGVNVRKGLNLLGLFWKLKKSDADLLHVNYLGVHAWLAFLSGKKYVLHVHGSDVRDRSLCSWKRKVLENAERVLFSTSDLESFVPEGSVYLPVVVGDQFFDMGLKRTVDFAFRRLWYENCRKSGAFVFWGFPYCFMPFFLNRVDVFVDRASICSLSKTALEALACGCKVLDFNDELVVGLRSEHRVSNVVKLLVGVYEEFLC